MNIALPVKGKVENGSFVIAGTSCPVFALELALDYCIGNLVRPDEYTMKPDHFVGAGQAHNLSVFGRRYGGRARSRMLQSLMFSKAPAVPSRAENGGAIIPQ